MRSYLRLDPGLADRKESYPDGAFAAFVMSLCFAEHQPKRGRFKSLSILRAHLGKRARWISYLLGRGDLVELESGQLYIEGWDEWQEGDWKVNERVQRIRSRRKVTPDVTVPVTDDVTAGVTGDRRANQREAVGGRRKQEEISNAPPGETGPREVRFPNGRAESLEPEVVEVVTTWEEAIGRQHSAADVIAARGFLAEFKRLEPQDVALRLREYLDWLRANGKSPPRELQSCRNTLRLENDRRADDNAPLAARHRPIKRSGSLTHIATGSAE